MGEKKPEDCKHDDTLCFTSTVEVEGRIWLEEGEVYDSLDKHHLDVKYHRIWCYYCKYELNEAEKKKIIDQM